LHSPFATEAAITRHRLDDKHAHQVTDRNLKFDQIEGPLQV
jgi:hypothetical protein